MVGQAVQAQLDAMHAKYEARESRPDDVQRINSLERQLMEADAQKKRAVVSGRIEIAEQLECGGKTCICRDRA